MNKHFIVLLVVCLVSVHAFVKRDAEVPKPNTEAQDYMKNIQTQVQDLAKGFNDKLSEALNPEQLKKGFNEFVENFSKAIGDLKPKDGAAKQ